MTCLRWLILALTTGCAVLPPDQIDPRQPRGETRILRRAPDGRGQMVRLQGDDLVVTRGTPRTQGEQIGHLFKAEILERVARRSAWADWRLRREAGSRYRTLTAAARQELEGVADSTRMATDSLWLAQLDDSDEDAWLPAVFFSFRDTNGKVWQGGMLAARKDAPRPIWHLHSPGSLVLEEPGGFGRPLLTLDRPGGALVSGQARPAQVDDRSSRSPVQVMELDGCPARLHPATRVLDRAIATTTGPWDRSRGWSVLASASLTAGSRTPWSETPWSDSRMPRGAWLWDPGTRTLDLAFGRTTLEGAGSFIAAPLPRLWRGGRPEAVRPLRNVFKAGKRLQRR
jgi:hypothetical protein